MIIKAKIWGAYRQCELLGSKGNMISVRVLGGYQIQGMPAEHEISLNLVREEDRQKCLDTNPSLEKQHQITMKKDILFPDYHIKLREGSSFKTRSLQYSGDTIVVSLGKYHDLRLPLEAIKIQESKNE